MLSTNIGLTVVTGCTERNPAQNMQDRARWLLLWPGTCAGPASDSTLSSGFRARGPRLVSGEDQIRAEKERKKRPGRPRWAFSRRTAATPGVCLARLRA